MVKTNIQTFTGEVEILKNLFVGSNLLANDVASNVLNVTGRIGATNFIGDGGLLSNIATTLDQIVDQGNTVSNTIVFVSGNDATSNTGIVTYANVGISISNTNPTGEFQFSIGSNVFANTHASNAFTVVGRLGATNFIGDGGLLSNIATTLDQIVDQGNTVSNTIVFVSGNDATSNMGIVTHENVGISISNVNPSGEFQFGVGSNLFVNVYSSNVLAIEGNVSAEKMTLGTISVTSAYGLNHVTNQGSTTGDTITLTNATTGLVAASNIVVGGNVSASNVLASGNVEVGNRLKFSGSNVFVDDLRIADLAANLVTYDKTTGELMDSGGLFANKIAVVSVQPPSVLTGNTTTITKHGTYTVSTSSLAANSDAWDAFDGTAAEWTSSTVAGTLYNAGGGVYGGTSNLFTGNYIQPGVSSAGEWLAVEFPYKTTLRHMKLTPPATLQRYPASANVYATNDSLTWTEVAQWEDVIPTDTTPRTILVNASESFKKYAMVVTKSAGTTTNVALADWKLFTESFSIDGGVVTMPASVTLGNLTVTGDTTVSSNLEVGTANLFVDTVNSRVGVNTATPDASLHVTGNAYVSSNLEVGSELAVTGNVAVDTDTLFVDTVNNRTGIGTATPQKTLEVAGPMRITDGLSNVCDLSIGSAVGAFATTGTKIQGSDKQAGDNFGSAVSMNSDGTKLIVGANREGDSYPGAAYIYALSNGSWSQEAKIIEIESSRGYFNYFGTSVSMSADGTKVIVGANGATPAFRGGAAYIFTFSSGSWSPQQKIVPSDLQASDYFGISVCMSSDGTKVIVGASLEDTGGTSAGAAYIFAYSSGSWSQEEKIQASDKQANDYFGWSVSMSSDGTKAIVGAYREDTGGSVNNELGSAYIFALSGGSWSQEAKIQASDKQVSDQFGYSVSMSSDGTKVLVGAWKEDTGGSNAGAAYIFALSGGSWSQEAKIQASDKQANVQFGSAVSMNSDGTKVIVGAQYEDTGGTNAGAAYIFALSGGVGGTWSQQLKIQASDLQADDEFGISVAMSGNGAKAVVGAIDEDTGGSDIGAAYIFEAPVLNALVSSTAISADGTTLSFTGQHICVPEGPMSPGLVVSANKNRYVSLNGTLTTGVGAIRSSESLPVVSLSNVVSDRSVFGVVDRLEQGGTTERRQVVGATVVTAQKELGDTRVIVNSLGEGAIWVADTNGPLVSGDYMTTSNITGYAQKQDDDILHNYTVAKITMDCDFNPDDVPIQVIKKNDTGYNDLDVYGRIQWEDHPLKTTQKAYTIGYLTVDGNRTDEANAVHRTAFVGCTYHCG